jgi:hypothetical protein
MYLIENIEVVQKRAMKIIKPFSTYTLALEDLQLESLKERRDTLCLSFFKKLENPSDRLNCLTPSTSESKYNLREKPTYKIPNYKTNRAKNSFIPWCANKALISINMQCNFSFYLYWTIPFINLF